MSTTTAHKVQKAKTKHKKSGSVSSAFVSKTWDVTNNSGTDLLVIDAFASDPSSTDEMYGRSLQLLSADDAAQFIKAGETKTINVGEAHTDADGNPVDFEIILARADNFFPVKIVGLVNDDAESFPAVAVTPDDASVMKKAEAFVQTITAFPSSDLAVNYSTAVQSADEQKIADLFQSSGDYTTVTLDAVVAVQAYYNRYAFVWAGYKAAQTYALSTSDGTTETPIGTLIITNKTTAPVTNLDDPTGFAVIYADRAYRKTTLYYSAGQFSEDVNSDSPKICFQGLFVQKSQLTGVATDDILIPTLRGSVNGGETFGYLNDSVDGKTFVSDLLDPQGVKGWATLLGLCAGALALLAGLGVAAYSIVKHFRKGLSPACTPEEIQWLEMYKVAKVLVRMHEGGVRVPDDLGQALSDIKAEANLNLLANTKEKMKVILDKQSRMAKTLLDYGRTADLQRIFASIENDRVFELPLTDPADMAANMDTFLQHIISNATVIGKRYRAIGGKLSQSEAQLIDDCTEIADRYIQFVDSNEEIRKDLNDDRLPEIEE